MIGMWLAASDVGMRVSRLPQAQMSSSLRGASQEQSSLRYQVVQQIFRAMVKD